MELSCRNTSHLITYLLLILFLPLSACEHSKKNRPEYNPQTIPANWNVKSIPSGQFNLTAIMPIEKISNGTVYIYIEGDGAAWSNRNKPSTDPTPIHSPVLQMAINQGMNAAYLARPCQYEGLNSLACQNNRWWTSHRFAPEVIEATSVAIDHIKHLHKADKIILIGYSGGGAVAALAAAKRGDVIKLVTYAGNLDTEAWTTMHKVTPLSGSLNPADQWEVLKDIPQKHYVGNEDKIIPPAIAQSYAARFPADKRPSITMMNGYNHSCCWANTKLTD